MGSVVACHLVCVRRVVARGHAHQEEEEEGSCEEAATVGRREEAEHREHDGEDPHDEQLHARSEGGTEQDGVGRGAQDVGVDELPAALLLQVLLVLLVVPAMVTWGHSW